MGTRSKNSTEKAVDIFRRHQGMLRTKEALVKGIHPRTLYALRKEGMVVEMARGLHRLAKLPPLGNPDLATVALKVPESVICLVSALAFHELTTQVPHEVYVALPKDQKAPRLVHPPIRVFHYDGRPYRQGFAEHRLDGVTVRIYTPEKTLADCFKFRNKIGLDAVLEALKLYMRRKSKDLDTLQKYARLCRVERIMRPYLEALL